MTVTQALATHTAEAPRTWPAPVQQAALTRGHRYVRLHGRGPWRPCGAGDFIHLVALAERRRPRSGFGQAYRRAMGGDGECHGSACARLRRCAGDRGGACQRGVRAGAAGAGPGTQGVGCAGARCARHLVRCHERPGCGGELPPLRARMAYDADAGRAVCRCRVRAASRARHRARGASDQHRHQLFQRQQAAVRHADEARACGDGCPSRHSGGVSGRAGFDRGTRDFRRRLVVRNPVRGRRHAGVQGGGGKIEGAAGPGRARRVDQGLSVLRQCASADRCDAASAADCGVCGR